MTSETTESVTQKPVRSNKNFYITFPVKYLRLKHPTVEKVNPNGYAVVKAHSSAEAYVVAFMRYGHAWSHCRTEEDFSAGYFPDGCFEAMEVTGDADAAEPEYGPVSTEGL